MQRSLRASLTVEAALTLPLFFLLMLSLISIITGIEKTSNMQGELYKAASSYAAAGGEFKDPRVRFDEENGFVYKTYVLHPPGVKGLSLKTYSELSISDYKGHTIVPGEGGDSCDEWVYITAHPSVYHTSRECTYLKPHISQVFVGELMQKRNASGGRYYPCKYCCRNMNSLPEGTVYLTRYGTAYHIDKNCPDIWHDIRRVKKSEAGSLKECSKCSGEFDIKEHGK
ncbi:MAG: TadE family protein [Lachnospiraceae bacterium]|jgi:hypothetical protein|nr:TadE family protein [Lachnospiraceae bacterium]MEE3460427.1 TadE family protein [Lachnospiraceae bacterium]